MCRHMHIELAALCWPHNVLAFHAAVRRMKPGDSLNITIDDAGAVGVFRQLLARQPELAYKISKRRARFRIQICRQSSRDRCQYQNEEVPWG